MMDFINIYYGKGILFQSFEIIRITFSNVFDDKMIQLEYNLPTLSITVCSRAR